jgi:hypothetical protein
MLDDSRDLAQNKLYRYEQRQLETPAADSLFWLPNPTILHAQTTP